MLMNKLLVLALALTISACGGSGDGGGDGSMPDGAMPDGAMPDGSTDSGGDAVVDAAPEPCSTDGEMRPVSCGSCGLAQEVCEGGVWVRGECMAEGECAPGAVEDEDLADCTSRSRICTAECGWSDWTPAGDAGECDVGATQSIVDACGMGTVQEQQCSDACVWEDLGECASSCGVLRTTPLHAEEICIPQGDFIRGDDTTLWASPPATVFVSTFALGRFAVTNERYLACRTAGGCSGDLNTLAEEALLDPARADHPVVGVTWFQSADFCSWDGDRRLLTGAEFEKAARGPSPRANPFPWDGTDYRCDLLPATGCPGVDGGAIPSVEDVDAYGGAASYYGVEGLFGGVPEWVSDWFSETYYSDPGSRRDPAGPMAGTERVYRGMSRREAFLMTRTISNRFRLRPDVPRGGFRCARSVEAAP